MNARPKETPFQPEGPQPLLRPISPGADYPVAALGPLRDAVEAVQGMTLAPVAIPAQSALSVASLAVMGVADVETLGGNRPVSLYCLTIAQSGERKSSCDAPLMAALRAWEKEQAEAQRDGLTNWMNAKDLWEGERSRILSEAKKGKGEKRVAAQADLDALGAAPSAPPSTDRTVTEPSFEGLTRHYVNGHPALGIFSDEGGQFLGGYAMNQENRQKSLAAFNDLWQGNPIRRTRAKEGELVTLFGRRLAMHLMVQPGVARTFMADPMTADTGFLPRFLICEPQSNIGNRPYAMTKPDDGRLADFSARLRAILDTPLPIDAETRALTPRHLRLSGEAKTLLIGFSDAIERVQAPGADLSHVTGYASKAAEQACRIAGVLALWRDLNAPFVTKEDMAHAIALAQFYLSEASRLADAATVSADTDRAEKLRIWLLETWPHAQVTPTDIVQHVSTRSLRHSPVAKKAIAMLVQCGWLVPLERGAEVQGKPRKEAYQIVGPAHVV